MNETDDEPSKPTSLTPFGLTLPHALKRLEEISQTGKDSMMARDADTIMAKLWEELNTPDPSINFGTVPVQSIIHVCTPECAKSRPFWGGVGTGHVYGKLDEHDARVASATVQWLATNIGQAFYRKFMQTLEKAQREKEE